MPRSIIAPPLVALRPDSADFEGAKVVLAMAAKRRDRHERRKGQRRAQLVNVRAQIRTVGNIAASSARKP